MKNCLILGFGRSGTSMLGGILHQNGYYLGDNLYPPRHSNPKGFFEDKEINRINELILSAYDGLIKPDNDHNHKLYSPFKPRYGHRWLSYIPFETEIECFDYSIIANIKKYLELKPFSYKDPRFCFTYDIWAKYLNEPLILLVMFRDPLSTVNSILEECKTAKYLSEFEISRQLAIDLWINYYRRILLRKMNGISEKIYLIHYDSLISNKSTDRIGVLLQTKLHSDFIDPVLNRSAMVDNEKHFDGYKIDDMIDLYNKLLYLQEAF